MLTEVGGRKQQSSSMYMDRAHTLRWFEMLKNQPWGMLDAVTAAATAGTLFTGQEAKGK